MRLFRLAVAAVLVFAACGAGASGTSKTLPADLIGSCLAELRASASAEGFSDSHLFDLQKRCPELVQKLDWTADSGVLGWTSIEGLRDLRFFEAGFHGWPESRAKFVPDFDGLDALLADVLIEETVEDGLWEKFLRWLEQFAKDDESPEFNRFLDWLDDVDAPPWLGDAILNTSIALILLMALMIIGNELRLSGVLRRFRRPSKMRALDTGMDAAPKAHAMSIDDLGELPSREMAAAVLRIVTETFVDRGWLSPNPSLTNGECVKEIGQRQREFSGPFGDLVNTVETIIYGGRSADEDGRQRLRLSASRMIERIRGEAKTAPKGSG
jgi:hypothetical protein